MNNLNFINSYDLGFALLSFLILAAGSMITMRIFAKARRSTSLLQTLWLFLAGIVGGGTMWGTHFLAMIAYRVPITHSYDTTIAVASLFLAIAVASCGFLIAASTQRSPLIETGGFIVAMGMVGVQYFGVIALDMDATIEWNLTFIAVSVISAGFFGAIATNRVARPVTRFCKYGGTLSFFLAVSTLHYIGMSGIKFVPPSFDTIPLPQEPHTYLVVSVIVVLAVIYSTSISAYLIDQRNSQEATSKINHIALHDPLTKLANRARAEEYLQNLLSGDMDDTARIAIISLGLDRFREVNDAYGQASGDVILKKLAARFSECLEENEFIARFSGDEFVAVKFPIYMDRQTTGFCKRLQAAVEEPINTGQSECSLSASIGYAYYPDAGADPKQLMQRAHLAMYASKANGCGKVTAFSNDFDEISKTRSSLSQDLKHALKNDEFELYYQLQNDANTREVVGAEALLRWNHPEKGRIPPDLFISIAEETGRIVDIGDWVLRTACEEATHWAMPYSVAINVAAQQLTDIGFPAKVEAALHASGLDPARLEIEITETGIITDISFVLGVLKELKSLGVKIAMDDYGTGYSSLSTLQSFPFDKIKIDREFIKELPANKHSEAIVKATIILGTSLGIPILAEGVETEEHLAFLNDEGCKTIQGFLFGKPMPSKDIRDIAIDERCRAFDGILKAGEENLVRFKKAG